MNGMSENFLSVEWSFSQFLLGKIIQAGKTGMSKGIETQTYKFNRQTDRQTDRQKKTNKDVQTEPEKEDKATISRDYLTRS